MEDNTKGEDMLEVLKRQNLNLRKTLEEYKQTTSESMSLLSYSEDSLNFVVAQLRKNILMHHKNTIKLIRQKFQVETIPLEDEEFKKYLENINDLQKLTDISHTYRLLLRLHVKEWNMNFQHKPDNMLSIF